MKQKNNRNSGNGKSGSDKRRNGSPKGMNRNSKKRRSLSKSVLQEGIMNFFTQNPEKVVNYKQVSSAVGAKTSGEKNLVVSLLDSMAAAETLEFIDYGKYKLNTRNGYVEGVIDRRPNGKTYLVPDDGGREVFIAERRLRHALDKDRVRIFLYATPKGAEPEGEVVEVLQRAQDTFVGVLQASKDYAFLRVDNKILTNDIFIPAGNLNGGTDGQKAVVKIVEWDDHGRNPIGRVVDVLGNQGDNNTEMHAILAEYGLPYSYPRALEEAADRIPADLDETEFSKRRDMRDVPTFTIDPKDAKDFDDALSIRRLESGLWEIGVHIADVTHYVTPDSPINAEAEKRATSVYLVDRTIPMLPEHLSNELCSLRPDEDKLTFSVVFEMDEKAHVKHYDICRTVIRSDRRFAYEEAQDVIETGEGDMKVEILQLDKLAKILRKNRFENGAISFENSEVRFDIDEKGKPLSVYFKESKDANKLIEEFMLLANRTVAEHIGKVAKGKQAKTFVYRVHDVPNPDKLRVFSDFIKKFGYKLKTTGKSKDISNSINKLLSDVEGKREQELVQTIAVRSMAKAVYTTVNIGHYGLAFDYYTHFTSPIRRYPDMMVHRLLEKYMSGGRSEAQKPLEEKCDHCSAMEQLAATAERSSIKYKQVEFMSDKIGKVFDGVISGVTEWGIYVELNANKCEGMIPLRNLGNDYFIYDEKNYCVVGKRSGKKFQLGDSITIRVVKTNLEKKQMDFGLVD